MSADKFKRRGFWWTVLALFSLTANTIVWGKPLPNVWLFSAVSVVTLALTVLGLRNAYLNYYNEGFVNGLAEGKEENQ